MSRTVFTLLLSLGWIFHASMGFAEITRFPDQVKFLPQGVVEFVESLHQGPSEHLDKSSQRPSATGTTLDSEYLPQKRPEFNLGYYLLPLSRMQLEEASSLSPDVRDQLIVNQGGTRLVRLFVHPSSEEYYKFLSEEGHQFVSPEDSEFRATVTTSHRSLVVWNHRSQSTPFVAKTSLNRESSGENRVLAPSEVVRSVANQKALDIIGRDYVEDAGLDYFPETAGFNFDDSWQSPHKVLGGQIIREIPKGLIDGTERWIPFGVLMSDGYQPRLLLKVIQASGLSAFEFMKKYFVEDFMDSYQAMAHEKGFNLTTHSQNMGIITDGKYQMLPDRKFFFQDFGGIRPNMIRMLKEGGGQAEAYIRPGMADLFRFHKGVEEVHDTNYTVQYKEWVFRLMMLEGLKEMNPGLSREQQAELFNLLGMEMQDHLAKYYAVPNANTDSSHSTSSGVSSTLMSSLWIGHFLDRRSADRISYLYEGSSTVSGSNGQAWRDMKDKYGERTSFTSSYSKDSMSFATDKAIYHTRSGRIVSLYVFTFEERELYAKLGADRIEEFFQQAVQLREQAEQEKRRQNLLTSLDGPASVVLGKSLLTDQKELLEELKNARRLSEAQQAVVDDATFMYWVGEYMTRGARANENKLRDLVFGRFNEANGEDARLTVLERFTKAYYPSGLSKDRWGTAALDYNKMMKEAFDTLDDPRKYEVVSTSRRLLKNFVRHKQESSWGRQRESDAQAAIVMVASLMAHDQVVPEMITFLNESDIGWTTSASAITKGAFDVANRLPYLEGAELLQQTVFKPLLNFVVSESNFGRSRNGDAASNIKAMYPYVTRDWLKANPDYAKAAEMYRIDVTSVPDVSYQCVQAFR